MDLDDEDLELLGGGLRSNWREVEEHARGNIDRRGPSNRNETHIARRKLSERRNLEKRRRLNAAWKEPK